MFQALKRKTFGALVVSVGIVGATYNPKPLYLEGKEQAKEQRKQKLPVYDAPEPEMVIQEEPTRIGEALDAARKETDRQILGMKYHLQLATNKVVEVEKEIETNVRSVLVSEEQVMPGAIYVIVAGFAGSIFASRRNVVLRFLTPVAFSAMAFGYFFPASSNRLIEKVNKTDFSKFVPAEVSSQVKELTKETDAKVHKVVEEAKEKAKEAQKVVEAKAKEVKQEVKEIVAKEEKKIEAKIEDTKKNV